jgi:hypothetical protein
MMRMKKSFMKCNSITLTYMPYVEQAVMMSIKYSN